MTTLAAVSTAIVLVCIIGGASAGEWLLGAWAGIGLVGGMVYFLGE